MRRKEPDIYDAVGELRTKRLLDIEITVKCVIRGAASLSELKQHYDNDPLMCAKSLADNDQGLCGTIDCEQFEIIEARIKP